MGLNALSSYDSDSYARDTSLVLYQQGGHMASGEHSACIIIPYGPPLENQYEGLWVGYLE